MNIEKFINDFAEEIEDVDMSDLTAETHHKDLDGWDSLTVLTVISMIKLNYGVDLSGLEVNECASIADIYALVEKAHG